METDIDKEHADHAQQQASDALATAFMVMGLEEAEAFCKADTTIDAYFIYSGEDGEFKTYYTEGMKKYITTP